MSTFRPNWANATRKKPLGVMNMLQRMKLEGKLRNALRSGGAENSHTPVDMRTGTTPPGYGETAAQLWRMGWRPTGESSMSMVDMSRYPPHSAYAAIKGMPGNGITVQPTYASLEETVPGYVAPRYTPVPTTTAGFGGLGGMPGMPSGYVYHAPANGMGLGSMNHRTIVNPGVSTTLLAPSSRIAYVPAPAPSLVPVANVMSMFRQGPPGSRAISPARRRLYESMGMAPPGLPLASRAQSRGRDASRGRGASVSGRGASGKAGSKKRTQRKQRR